MKRKTPMGSLVAAVCATGILLYVIGKTPSPKIILLPFLICSLAMVGRGIAQILGKDKLAAVFHKCYVAGFLLFLFGFLAVAGYIAIRDKHYSLLLLAIPFLLIGLFLVQKQLLGKKGKRADDPLRFAHVVSTVLVSVVLLAGAVLLVLGIRRSQWVLTFMGTFFLCGGGAFVLGTLSVRGVFDKAKIDIMGLYFGVVFAAIGMGFTVMLCQGSASIGAWILIPLLMSAVGVLQIIKCFQQKK